MTVPAIRTEINKEIVLLRQCVRQARICVINKLVREAKRLRVNRGTEKQLEKNKNKADKFMKEVFALKRIKDDEISKFGIVSLENLQDISQNLHADDESRAMAKVAHYKSLKVKLMEFKKKFPDYEKYISWRKKKHSPKKRRTDPVDEFPEENSKRSSNDITGIKVGTRTEGVKNPDNVTSIDRSRYTTRPSVKADVKYDKSSDETLQCTLQENKPVKRPKVDRKDSTKISNTINDQGSKSATKIISNQAVVKRFAELLQETTAEGGMDSCEANNNQQLFGESVENTRKADDFFLNSDEDVSCSNATMLSRERTNSVSTVGSSTFGTFQVKNGKDKFSRERVNKERRNNKIRKVSSEDTSYDRNSIREGSVTHWKQNKSNARIQKMTAEGSIESRNPMVNENLHPSWLARRKQQEIMKQGFQGKKIRFDEN